MEQKRFSIVLSKNNKIKHFDTGKDIRFFTQLFVSNVLLNTFYISRGLFYIYISFLMMFGYLVMINLIFLAIILFIFFSILMYKYGNLLAIWTYLVSGWTFAEPELLEVKKFIEEYNFKKYVKKN